MVDGREFTADAVRGECPTGALFGHVWYNVSVHVRGHLVTVLLNGQPLATPLPYHKARGRVGVMAPNRYNNTVHFTVEGLLQKPLDYGMITPFLIRFSSLPHPTSPTHCCPKPPSLRYDHPAPPPIAPRFFSLLHPTSLTHCCPKPPSPSLRYDHPAPIAPQFFSLPHPTSPTHCCPKPPSLRYDHPAPPPIAPRFFSLLHPTSPTPYCPKPPSLRYPAPPPIAPRFFSLPHPTSLPPAAPNLPPSPSTQCPTTAVALQFPHPS